MNQNSNCMGEYEPPKGGADLECILTCECLQKKTLLKIVDICFQSGFKFVEKDFLLSYGDDPIVPEYIAVSDNLLEFMERVEVSDAKRYIVNFSGQLHDIQTYLSLVLDFKNAVLVISVPEDVLWAFSENPQSADFLRLICFGKICEEISMQVSAKFAYMGTEFYHIDEMKLENAERLEVDRANLSFFSEPKLKELFDWYLSSYTKRWEV